MTTCSRKSHEDSLTSDPAWNNGFYNCHSNAMQGAQALEAEKKLRRIKGDQEILLLKERLNTSRIRQKEVRTVEVA